MILIPTRIRPMIIRKRPRHMSQRLEPAAAMRILDAADALDIVGGEKVLPSRQQRACLGVGGDELGGCEGGEDGVVDCEGEEEGWEEPAGQGASVFGGWVVGVGVAGEEGAGGLDGEAGEDGEEEGGDGGGGGGEGEVADLAEGDAVGGLVSFVGWKGACVEMDGIRTQL